MTSPHVVLVTGANRGIGYGIVSLLSRQYGGSWISQKDQKPLKIYIGSRSIDKGNEALKSLNKELESVKGKFSLDVCQIDINDQKSRKAAIDLLKEREGGLDTLIDNAGIALDGFDANVVKETLETNFHNLISFNDEILPIIRPNGRIVILASMAGKLKGYSDEIINRFKSVKTVDEAKSLANEFEQAVKDGNHEKQGWKSAAYSVSKACVIAYTRAMASQLENQKSSITINCCCPGYVKTDMTKQRGVKSLDEGASTPVMLALENLNNRSGGFYENEKESSW